MQFIGLLHEPPDGKSTEGWRIIPFVAKKEGLQRWSPLRMPTDCDAPPLFELTSHSFATQARHTEHAKPETEEA